ncbi:MAG: glycoside hydrolase family 3 protein [Candidatus Promineifilaceae bacterium]
MIDDTAGPEAPVLSEGGHVFRDLNKNGELDAYEDSRLPIETRVDDLLQQMTLEEKAGLMFHPAIGMGAEGQLLEEPGPMNPIPTSEYLYEKKINHFNLYHIAPLKKTAEWYNRLQKMAERSRLGIPVTISSDPRHSFSDTLGASLFTEGFSHWPEQLGLAAAGDEAMVEQFGDMARQEYMAIGIRVALHPMADLATEPRWARCNGTFGEDAALSAKMTAAYIRGFQGEELGPTSVACMTKHFPGGGPQKDGEDAHFAYGKDQVYPGDNFDYHLIPFDAAFEAKTAQIMPYYGRPLGLDLEEVGFGYNKDVVTSLLREKYGFDGVVCTDWGLVNDVVVNGEVLFPARAWGAEDLSAAGRVRKIIEAGCDQFGGEFCPELIVELVNSGELSEERLDQSVRRLLRDKFRLGLFDDPYVDAQAVESIAGREDFVAAGELAQRRSMVLLKNGNSASGTVLPLRGKPRLYVENLAPELAGRYGQVVDTPEEADFAILRLQTPYEKREGFLDGLFHAGDLDFKGPDLAHIMEVCGKVPTIVDIYLDRPAVIPEITAQSFALIADFGAADSAVLDVIFGQFSPTGRLPFELPSSMEAVRAQKEDLPCDSENPLFPYGFGLSYS